MYPTMYTSIALLISDWLCIYADVVHDFDPLTPTYEQLQLATSPYSDSLNIYSDMLDVALTWNIHPLNRARYLFATNSVLHEIFIAI